MPTVSVIIPAYGHAEFILQTLDSVLAQSFLDYEVIVINDGSPDNTADVLAPLIEAGKIRYFEQTNQGVAAARNFGIEQASGEFIALLDDDDLWPPDKLEWQVGMMIDPNIIAVGGGAEFITKNGIRRDVDFSGEVKEIALARFFEGNPFMSPGQILFRKVAFDRGVRFDSAIWGVDDLDFWMGLTQHGLFINVNRFALQYRIHESNASRNLVKMMINCRKVYENQLSLVSASEFKYCRKAAYRWLYNVYGRSLIWDVKNSFLFRNPPLRAGLLIGMELTRTFSGTLFQDPWIFKQFAKQILKKKDLTPKWF